MQSTEIAAILYLKLNTHHFTNNVLFYLYLILIRSALDTYNSLFRFWSRSRKPMGDFFHIAHTRPLGYVGYDL